MFAKMANVQYGKHNTPIWCHPKLLMAFTTMFHSNLFEYPICQASKPIHGFACSLNVWCLIDCASEEPFASFYFHDMTQHVPLSRQCVCLSAQLHVHPSLEVHVLLHLHNELVSQVLLHDIQVLVGVGDMFVHVLDVLVKRLEQRLSRLLPLFFSTSPCPLTVSASSIAGPVWSARNAWWSTSSQPSMLVHPLPQLS